MKIFIHKIMCTSVPAKSYTNKYKEKKKKICICNAKSSLNFPTTINALLIL